MAFTEASRVYLRPPAVADAATKVVLPVGCIAKARANTPNAESSETRWLSRGKKFRPKTLAKAIAVRGEVGRTIFQDIADRACDKRARDQRWFAT